MYRFIFLSVILLALAILLSEGCGTTVSQDSRVLDSVLGKYVKHNVALSDSIINYSFQDSLLILKFPVNPESKKWLIGLDTCSLYEYHVNSFNEIKIGKKCPRIKGDSSVFFLQVVPYDRYIYYFEAYKDIVYFVFYSNKNGVLRYQKPLTPIIRIDTKIGEDKYFNDPKYHKAIVDSLNSLLGSQKKYFK